jgi:hypothetical protein
MALNGLTYRKLKDLTQVISLVIGVLFGNPLNGYYVTRI